MCHSSTADSPPILLYIAQTKMRSLLEIFSFMTGFENTLNEEDHRTFPRTYREKKCAYLSAHMLASSLVVAILPVLVNATIDIFLFLGMPKVHFMINFDTLEDTVKN